MRYFVFLSSVLFVWGTLTIQSYAAIHVYEFDSPKQEQQFKELTSTLRCPKCQNNTIADSNSALAQDLRQKVYQMVKQKKSSEDIINFMVARYGKFINYNPELTASTAILWVAPGMVLLVGFGFIYLRAKKSDSMAESTLSYEDELRLTDLLDETSRKASGSKRNEHKGDL